MALLALHTTTKRSLPALPHFHWHVKVESAVAFAVGAGLSALLVSGHFFGAATLTIIVAAVIAHALSCTR
ncbi:Na+-translocating ferredoxin:NAD+ oxidoreductase RnfD subunit [Rhizomicrobium palustre]|uniref:Na+-translocating ferredoxin:NAD+ oxidoreductase RnfD subunit n=1 Tax=Rhizomicrobium palustre TaxID=189966 RepID=A0A846N424_9PROT|nr:hypothetical protein [Rhizomicrobium palustre]NIK90215.1 Na+-translocating ferredoxin:NAD+ oxidoreductase RnfD subunit [Rhizomicrobium palustre]